MTFQVPDKYRVTHGPYASTRETDGENGLFSIMLRINKKEVRTFTVRASDGDGWEHVSVSLPDRCPTWPEMCKIKGLFWGPDDAVVQFHPPKSDYVNVHPNCLHMWRKIGQEWELPPSIMVGPKTKEKLVLAVRPYLT